MTHDEVETKLKEARQEDGTFDMEIIAEMNAKGVYFKFTNTGIAYTLSYMNKEDNVCNA